MAAWRCLSCSGGELEPHVDLRLGAKPDEIIERHQLDLVAHDVGHARLRDAQALAACACVSPSRSIQARSTSASCARSSITDASCGASPRSRNTLPVDLTA